MSKIFYPLCEMQQEQQLQNNPQSIHKLQFYIIVFHNLIKYYSIEQT